MRIISRKSAEGRRGTRQLREAQALNALLADHSDLREMREFAKGSSVRARFLQRFLSQDKKSKRKNR